MPIPASFLEWDWTDPFYDGDVVGSTEVPATFPVAINGIGFIVDLEEYRHRTLPMLRAGADDGDEQGEQSFSNEGTWKRSQSNWRHGAGQRRFDDRDDRDRSRFFESFGVDVLTTEGELSLLPDTTERVNSAATNLGVLYVNGFFVWIDGTGAKLSDQTDLSSATTVSGLSGNTITGYCTDGSTVYVADGTDVRSFVPAAGAVAASTAHTFDADKVWYANNRLIASNEDVLSELSSDGTTATTIMDHRLAAYDWRSVVGTPKGIFAAGAVGSQGEIWFLNVDVTDGTLDANTIAATFNPGETPYCLLAAGSVMFIGTDRGLRAGLINDGTIDYGRVIELPGVVRCLCAEDDYVWFGWEDFDATHSGLGRVYLGAWGDEAGFVFAYASDVMATSTADVLSVARGMGRTIFALSGDGIYGTGTALVAEGWVSTGPISYGTVEDKNLVSIDIEHDALPAGSSIAVEETHRGTTTEIGANGDTGSYGPSSPWATGDELVAETVLRFILTRATDTTDGPTLTRWTLRALPAGKPVYEIMVPVILRYSVGVDHLQGAVDAQTFQPVEHFEWFKELEAAKTKITYQELSTSYEARIHGVVWQPTGYTWEADDVWFEGIALLRLLTVEA